MTYAVRSITNHFYVLLLRTWGSLWRTLWCSTASTPSTLTASTSLPTESTPSSVLTSAATTTTTPAALLTIATVSTSSASLNLMKAIIGRSCSCTFGWLCPSTVGIWLWGGSLSAA